MTADTTTAPERDDRPHGWLIHKAGRGWYRPNARGYTGHICEAGRYSHDDALSYSHPNGWGGPRDGITIKHESDVHAADLCRAPVAQDAEPVALREPTEDMLNAARDWSYKKYGTPIGNDAAIGCWQAMFDAAPQPSDEAATLRAHLTRAKSAADAALAKAKADQADEGIRIKLKMIAHTIGLLLEGM